MRIDIKLYREISFFSETQTLEYSSIVYLTVHVCNDIGRYRRIGVDGGIRT